MDKFRTMRTPLMSGSTTNSSLNSTANNMQMSVVVPTKQPPVKRRRLGSSTPTASIVNSVVVGGVKPAVKPAGGIPTCIWCHRGLLAMPGGPVTCARCSALTCTVCSRTCTSTAPSQPPTPHLSFSPSPSPSPIAPPQSPMPRRSVLGIRRQPGVTHATTTPTPTQPQPRAITREASLADVQMSSQDPEDPPKVSSTTSTVVAGKRRKVADVDDEAVENHIDFEAHNLEDSESDLESLDYGPGCGRVVCRNCCFENIRQSTITCFDCYGC